MKERGKRREKQRKRDSKIGEIGDTKRERDNVEQESGRDREKWEEGDRQACEKGKEKGKRKKESQKAKRRSDDHEKP